MSKGLHLIAPINKFPIFMPWLVKLNQLAFEIQDIFRSHQKKTSPICKMETMLNESNLYILQTETSDLIQFVALKG